MNRRQLFPVLGAAVLPFAARPLFAAAPAPGVSAEAHSIYERALVFDANLAPPLPDDLPYPAALADMVRNSGVTAVKTSLGGSGESFEDTITEIAYFQRLIEAVPDLFLQVRAAADFERAKRERR